MTRVKPPARKSIVQLAFELQAADARQARRKKDPEPEPVAAKKVTANKAKR